MDKKRKASVEGKFGWLAPDVNPNLITFASICAMVLAAFFVFRRDFLVAGILVILSGFFDMLDGAIAKKYGRQTAFGSFFDKTADRINDAIIVAAITLAGFVNPGLGVLVLGLMLISSYVSAVIDSMVKNKGEELSLRWLRLCVVAAGLFFAQLELAMFVLLVICLFAFFERFVFAILYDAKNKKKLR